MAHWFPHKPSDPADNYASLLAQIADKFFPVFATIFSFIALGYVAGRFNVLPTGRGRPVLASYIFNIALPAAVLYNSLTFTPKAGFIYTTLFVKGILYVAVTVIGLILVRMSAVSWAAVFLLGLSSVHSNDYAIGKNLLHALYANSTTDMTHSPYAVLMDDSTVLTYFSFAPITIYFLELRRNRELSLTWGKSLLYALIRTLLQPVVLAAVLGITLRIIFQLSNINLELCHTSKFCEWFGNGILQGLGSTISPIYLLYTGLVLVGSATHFSKPRHLMAIVIVAIIKLGVSPLLMILSCWVIPGACNVTENDILPMTLSPSGRTGHDNMSIFYFLYGTLPTSPIVVIFASQYDLNSPTFAILVLVTTLCFAPVSLIFLSLYYVSSCELFSKEAVTLVSKLTEGVGYTSLALGLWVLLVLVFLGRHKRFMYHFLLGQVLCLLLYTALIAAVMINDYSKEPFKAGAIAFAKSVAACLFCLLGSSYPFILGLADRGNLFSAFFTRRVAVWFICLCVLGPVALLALTSLPAARLCRPFSNRNYIWDYGNNVDASFVATKVCILSVAVVLAAVPRCIGYCRSVAVRREYTRYRQEPAEETSELSTAMRDFHNQMMGRRFSHNSLRNPWEVSEREANKFQAMGFISVVMAIITILVEIWGVFISISVTESDLTDKVDPAVQQLLLQKKGVSSMDKVKPFVGLVLLYQNIWLFIAIFVAGVFGTPIVEIRERLIAIKEAIVRCVLAEEELSLPSLEALPPETVLTCQRFIQYHMTACVSAIGQSIPGTFGQCYEDVFTGEQLVSWLINVGLAEDRADGVSYGSRLILGRVLCHIDQRRSFYDRHYFYRFSRDIPASVARPRSLNDSSSEAADEFQVTRNSRSLPDWF